MRLPLAGDRVSAAARAATLPIAVVIPAHDREDVIGRALSGVAAQTRPPAEVIVVDDCSSDATAAIAERLGAHVIRHGHNTGAAGARNTGMRAAGAEWIALLDSDDEWLPVHLETLWGLREGHVLVSTSSVSIPAPGHPGTSRFQGAVGRRPVALRSPAALVWPRNIIPASGFMVRRDALLEIGGYSETLRFAEDWDMLLRILDLGTGIVGPEVTSHYHLHGAQKHRRSEGWEAARRRIVAGSGDAAWCDAALLHRVAGARRWTQLAQAARAGRTGEALRHAAWLAGGAERLRGAAGLALWHLRAERRLERLAGSHEGVRL